MKRALAATAVLALALAGAFLAGCLGGPEADPGDRSGDGDGLPGTAVGYEPAGEELTWVEGHTREAGVFVKTFGDYRLVLVTMGEKPTAGYEVTVDEVTTSGEGWVVNVVFTEPDPGDMVATVITYPYAVVKIAADGRPVTVFDVTGEQPVRLEVAEE